MKCCKECQKKPWPYMYAMAIAAFIGFITWLTTGITSLSIDARYWITTAVIVIAIALITSYLLCCMSRHCEEDGHKV